MDLSTYSGLQAAVTDFMMRNDLSGSAAGFITLAEASLNRKLDAVETDAALTGVPGSRSISLASLSIARPIALFVVINGDEWDVTPAADGTFPYDDTAGQPSRWAIDGGNIDFDRPCDQAYTFRLRYAQRFALSDATPTNWLLENHPDVYLAAAIVWGCAFTQDFQEAGSWAGNLRSSLAEVRRQIAQNKPAMLVVDTALTSLGRTRTNLIEI